MMLWILYTWLYMYKTKANGVIVGIDLSGDPKVSDAVLDDRSAGYSIAVPFSVHVHH